MIPELPASVEALRRRLEDPHALGHRAHERAAAPGTGHGETGPAAKRIIVGYGFWIFLLSDIVMFSAFFAAFAVLRNATAGGPTIRQIVEPTRVIIETTCLLLSSFTCGLSFAATNARSKTWTEIFLVITGILGVAFVVLEANEFAGLAAEGATPQRSAFLTAFFSLVGLPRPARQRGPALAQHDGRPGLGEGLPGDDHPPAALLQPVLARARHHLGRAVHDRVPAGRTRLMSDDTELGGDHAYGHGYEGDHAPGVLPEESAGHWVRNYLIGLGLAGLLTAVSFTLAYTHLVWQPSIPVALIVLAIAQMGVHLVFFLHITTGPDNTNNVLALAFGILIVFLIVGGSIWIMDHLNGRTMAPPTLSQAMQMQP